ncbi:MAG: flagellar motor switch protein FliG [Spirochaetaceae bacterium]|jgi:flagellar motor switch protein FliG|nr:flagellar motor switch protein FliG [Spirochaetaceae bacterium]
MDSYMQRKINAYKKTSDDSSSGGDGADWLSQLAANDFSDESHAGKNSENLSYKTDKNTQDSLSFAEKAAAFAKIPKKKVENKDGEEQDSKYRRVAKFLILIGADQAAKVLANLEEEQVEKISSEVARINYITKEESVEIFAEFQGLLAQSIGPLGVSAGGVGEARKLLYATFGKEKGEAFLRRSVPEALETSFSFLEDFSGEQIALLLGDETPATAAMILSRLDPKVSAATLRCSEVKWRLETIRRIGHIAQISPEVLEKVAQALRDKARKIGSAATTNVDGMGALAAILKNADIAFGDKIIKELYDEDPELSQNLKERLYTLDDVIKAEDRPIQEKIHSMNSREVAILLKGRPKEFCEKIFSNMSSGRFAEVNDELAFMGPITKRDSDAALKQFMQWFRDEREEGNILIIGDDDIVE